MKKEIQKNSFNQHETKKKILLSSIGVQTNCAYLNLF